jgi:hypothetical protein
MKAYTDPKVVMDILANNKEPNFHAIVKGEKGHPYIYQLSDDDLETEYNGRELLRLAIEGNISIIEVEE